MKTRLIVSAFAAALMMLAAADASAQVATKKERKQIDKHESKDCVTLGGLNLPIPACLLTVYFPF